MNTTSNKFSLHRPAWRRLLPNLALILVTACSALAPPPPPEFPQVAPPSPTSAQPAAPTATTAPAATEPGGAAPTATTGGDTGVPLTGQAQRFDVSITDSAFGPVELTIPAGSTVVWTHNGSFPHTVTADDGSFASGTLRGGGTFEFTFNEVGVFNYYCEFHGGPGGSGMSASVTVVAAEQPPAATATAPAATATTAATDPAAASPTATSAQGAGAPTAAAPGPGVAITGALNRDATQAGKSPSLAVGTTTAGADPTLWAAWAENTPGNVRQIFTSALEGDTFAPRGASLNIHVNVIGDSPSITFAGENRLVPWVAWSEPSPGFGNVSQIFASRFVANTGLWQQAGQDRGGGEASLNLHTNRTASRPFIFGGSGDPTRPPVPWVAWEELSSLSSFTQIFVAHGVRDEAAIGGFRWEMVGQITNNNEPSLNVGHFRHGLRPTGVFAETGNTVPWVTWHESGGDQPERVFTARGVADPAAPGGFNWIIVPPCEPDETACALNINPLKDAKDASMAAGTRTPGEAAVPWIAWAERGPTDKWQVFVNRLDLNTRNSFLPVGSSLNVDENRDSRTPAITFVGNVPYVAWLEDNGSGRFTVHVRHLEAEGANVTWVLDSPPGGILADPALSATDLAIAGEPGALYLSWTEGDPDAEPSQVVTAELRP